jgi:hypothetical protein
MIAIITATTIPAVLVTAAASPSMALVAEVKLYVVCHSATTRMLCPPAAYSQVSTI